jgi:hypothetical protein
MGAGLEHSETRFHCITVRVQDVKTMQALLSDLSLLWNHCIPF